MDGTQKSNIGIDNCQLCYQIIDEKSKACLLSTTANEAKPMCEHQFHLHCLKTHINNNKDMGNIVCPACN